MAEVKDTLKRLPPFQCRVVAIGEFIDDDQYHQLLAASTFAVNCSLAEGQCLPLMEAMSSGNPVIAPRHTGMTEYVDDKVGFVLRNSLELCCWPHDPRYVFRARRYRGDWQSLVEAYRNAYSVVKRDPDRYQRMSEAASARMREFCSERSVYGALHEFLRRTALSHAVPKQNASLGRAIVADQAQPQGQYLAVASVCKIRRA